jgi:hypothetical protein
VLATFTTLAELAPPNNQLLTIAIGRPRGLDKLVEHVVRDLLNRWTAAANQPRMVPPIIVRGNERDSRFVGKVIAGINSALKSGSG